MAISLPPALTPEHVPVAEIRGQQQSHPVFTRGDIRVHVLGAETLDVKQLEAAVASGASLSDAVYAIQRALYQAGYPAARIRYALAAPDLYVMVTQPPPGRLDMPPRYARYFERTLAHPVLDEDSLEPARVLASLHADRAREQAALSLQVDGEAVSLGLRPEASTAPAPWLRASLGNPGTRFLGRYFADYGAQLSSNDGEDLALGGRHAVKGLNDREGDYREHSITYSRVTRYGIAGLTFRDLDYASDQIFPGLAESLALDGELQQAEGSWLTIPAAGFRHRWALGAKLDYTHKAVRADAFDTLLQKQEYASVELATDYTQAIGPIEKPIQLGASLGLRHGLGADRETRPPTLANLGYWLVRPAFNLATRIDGRFNLSVSVQTQFSADRVPEQQQWLAGGAGTLEAFLPGTLVGDSGGLARLQLGFPGWEFGQWKLVPSAFTDYARARLRVPDPTRSRANTEAADLGAALAITWGRNLDATLAYAEPLMDRGLTREARDDAEAGLLFRLTLMY